MKTIDRTKLPCKFLSEWWEDLAGDGGSREHMIECNYNGSDEVWAKVEDYMNTEPLKECGSSCPGFSPIEPAVCPKHECEYIEYCNECEAEREKEQEAAEIRMEQLQQESDS